ncbi:hypothetical protein [Clostridium lundense]|uniref:hypothetical protein n=1 Tax=Clostridium lundense TaxID=319475 RepID=UPI000489FB1A|nr:hypothetical protein [Clostridium lundense]
MDFINEEIKFPNEQLIRAKADFYRNILNKNNDFSWRTAEILNSDTDSLKRLIPKTMEKEILIEPLSKNSLKNYITISSIHGLEVPILSFMINGEYTLDEGDIKKEVEAKGNCIDFGRDRDLISTTVSDTVYHGTDTAFVNAVESGLRSVNEEIEIRKLFDLEATGIYEHMSLYKSGVKKINGIDIYEALKNAIQDLPKAIRRNAKIVMSNNDYIKLVEVLAAKGISSIPFKQEIIIEEECSNPVVGDLSFIHINYDGDILYNYKKFPVDGLWYFTLTVFRDIQIKLQSAFRIVSVSNK